MDEPKKNDFHDTYREDRDEWTALRDDGKKLALTTDVLLISAEVVTLAGASYSAGTTDGTGTAARFVSPRYMCSDNSGMLYIADTNGSKIRAVR